jgi:hypothetical protein
VSDAADERARRAGVRGAPGAARRRYNTVAGRLNGLAEDVRVTRVQGGAGWFVTPLVLMKGEYVRQTYLDFPTADVRRGGKFNGFVARASSPSERAGSVPGRRRTREGPPPG